MFASLVGETSHVTLDIYELKYLFIHLFAILAFCGLKLPVHVFYPLL